MKWLIDRRALVWLAGAGGVVAVLAGSCKKKETEYPPSPPQSYTSTPTAQPTTTAPPADAGPVDAGPKPLDAISEQMLRESIKKRAKKDAPGMQPLGDFFGGQLDTGGQVATQIMIDPNKCYGVIAGTASAGVTELDIQIEAKPVVPIPALNAVLAVDNTSGAEAAIKPCWKNVFPVGFPARVVITAKQGAGAVGAQVYSK